MAVSFMAWSGRGSGVVRAWSGHGLGMDVGGEEQKEGVGGEEQKEGAASSAPTDPARGCRGG